MMEPVFEPRHPSREPRLPTPSRTHHLDPGRGARAAQLCSPAGSSESPIGQQGHRSAGSAPCETWSPRSKAWAVFKGKFKEGDKAEPATWKTRLRCALNKSPDFEEVTDRSQLDISEPYKVYRIVPEEEQKCKLGVVAPGCISEATEMECGRSEIDELIKEPPVDDYMGMVKRSPSPPEACRSQLLPDWWMQQPSAGLPLVPGYSTYDAHHAAFSQMVISFYYGGKLMGQTTTTCPEGCRLSLGQPGLPGGKLCGPEGLELVRFPPADAIPSERQRQVTRKLFGHLERGVLLHSSRQGVLVKRQCQGRVFYSGNAAAGRGGPNKLERDEVVKVFDTSQFFRELQQFYSSQSRLPDSRVVLCFGEEFPDMTPVRSKLILVQVEQLYVRQLVEEAGKSCSAGSVMQAPEEPLPDQVFRMFPDICASHQRPFFRENQQITV
uniref:Interferon regulatory factor 8 isoform X2 n=1 Tax=Tursiops truncatus TaxID=9739 RepID=A0A6J3QEQ9_TURTR|nr:interferon regulatory factor 8 isoform X2 [Tursiops truncatus]